MATHYNYKMSTCIYSFTNINLVVSHCRILYNVERILMISLFISSFFNICNCLINVTFYFIILNNVFFFNILLSLTLTLASLNYGNVNELIFKIKTLRYFDVS